jgi:DNA-binding HxlR family transcriptional regulator
MARRDDVWHVVIQELVTRGKFRISDLDEFDEGQRHTVRRTLKEMEKKGWVTRTSAQSPIWRLGPLAKLTLNVDEETIERARKR